MAVNSVNSIRNQENRTRNTAIATVAGAGVGALGGALTSSPFKGEELKDSFVKQVVIKAAPDELKNTTQTAIDMIEKGLKLADEKGNFTPENAREYLSSLKDIATDKNLIGEVVDAFDFGADAVNVDDVAETFDLLVKNSSDKEVVEMANFLNNSYKESMETAKSEVKSNFDGKKLKELGQDATESAKDIFNTIKSTIKSNKMKAAAIVGAVGAAVCGVGAYLLTNKKADETKKAE